MQNVCFEILASFLRYITKIFLFLTELTFNKSRAYELNKWLFVSASRHCLQPVVNRIGGKIPIN